MTGGGSNEKQLVQQHLANERTYLAWIRTSITIIGLGFLSTNLVLGMTADSLAHMVAVIAGIGSIVLGGGTMALATCDFFIRRKSINNASFRSSTRLVWIVTGALCLTIILFVVLIIAVLLI